MMNGGVLADVVRAAPSILLGGPQRDAAVEKVLLERRLGQLQDQADDVVLRERSTEVITTFMEARRLDLGLVCALEVILEDQTQDETELSAKVIRRAGFDPFPQLYRAARAMPKKDRDQPPVSPAVLLSEFTQFIQTRLDRLNLQPFRELATAFGLQREMHEIQTLVDALRGAVLRHSVPLSDAWTEAIRLYRQGKLEIAEAARLLQTPPEEVAFEFERRGVTRGLEGILLMSDDRQARLRTIAQAASVQRTTDPVAFLRRDLVASQRIEDVDARAHVSRRGTDDTGDS